MIWKPSVKLKRCPYCKAGEPRVQYKPSKHKKYPWRVMCSNCGVRTDWCRLMSGAIDSWNMRDGVLTDVPTPFAKDTNVPGKPFWDSWIDAKDRLPKKQFTAAIEKWFDGVCVYDVSPDEAVNDFQSIVDERPTISTDKARGVVHCKDCKWWTKQYASIQGRCALLAIYPTGEFYCASGSMEEPQKEVE